MLNKDQIEAVETRLMGIITSSRELPTVVFDAVRALNDCRYLQENPVAPKPDTSDPCVKEEKCDNGVDKGGLRLAPCCIPVVLREAVDKAPVLKEEYASQWIVKVSDKHTEPLSIMDCKVADASYNSGSVTSRYVATVSGGNNGKANWRGYLIQLSYLLAYLDEQGYDAWIVNVKNDVLDDVFYAEIGFQKR